MADFHYLIPTESYVGTDTLYKLPLILEGGPERVFLVIDSMLSEAKLAERVVDVLEGRSIKTVVFDVNADVPTGESADRAAALARGARAPAVVGVGGVRTLHVAKAVASLATNDRRVEDWMDGNPPPKRPLPLVLLPTSFRDPFLLSDGLVLGDPRSGAARSLQCSPGCVSAAILDPNLTVGLSPKTVAACVLDAIMAAVEGYVSARENFFSDVILKEAITILVRDLDVLIQRPNEPQARLSACRGAFLLAAGISSSSVGLGTGVAWAISTRHRVPKSNLAAVMLPYLMEQVGRSRLDKMAALAPCFCPLEDSMQADEVAARAIESMRTRLGMLKIPSRLKDFELSLDKLVESAETARRFDFMNFLPRNMTTDDVFDFVKTVY